MRYSIDVNDRGVHVHEARRGSPLAIALHGGGGSGRQFAFQTGMHRTRDMHVAYLDGTPNPGAPFLMTWNALAGASGYAGQVAQPRDIDHVVNVVDVLIDELHVDESRIALVGLSNGAQLAHATAAYFPRVASCVLSVAGGLSHLPAFQVTPEHPRVTHLHGREDRIVPLEGGRGVDGFEHLPMEDIGGWWGDKFSMTTHSGGHEWPSTANEILAGMLGV